MDEKRRTIKIKIINCKENYDYICGRVCGIITALICDEDGRYTIRSFSNKTNTVRYLRFKATDDVFEKIKRLLFVSVYYMNIVEIVEE